MELLSEAEIAKAHGTPRSHVEYADLPIVTDEWRSLFMWKLEQLAFALGRSSNANGFFQAARDSMTVSHYMGSSGPRK